MRFWNDLQENIGNYPKPNQWVMIYQRFSKPNYTIGRLHFEMTDSGNYRNYWEWYSNDALGSPLICPGSVYVLGWMDIPDFYGMPVEDKEKINEKKA